MQESLPPEHGRELVANSLEELLDAGRISDEGNRHLETTGRDITVSRLDVVGDPLDEVGRVLGLDVLHLLLDLLHRDLASEVGSNLRRNARHKLSRSVSVVTTTPIAIICKDLSWCTHSEVSTVSADNKGTRCEQNVSARWLSRQTHTLQAHDSRVSSSHHVLRVEHLLSQLWNGNSSVLLGAPSGQGGESDHEEVQTGEGD